MKSPYDINAKILGLITSISEKIGEVNASFIIKSSPSLRKQNQRQIRDVEFFHSWRI